MQKLSHQHAGVKFVFVVPEARANTFTVGKLTPAEGRQEQLASLAGRMEVFGLFLPFRSPIQRSVPLSACFAGDFVELWFQNSDIPINLLMHCSKQICSE